MNYHFLTALNSILWYNCSIANANERWMLLASAPVLTTRKGDFPMATPDSTPFHRCSKCGAEYPWTSEYFYKDASKPRGVRGVCIPCQELYFRQYRERNRDRISASRKVHYLAHRESILEYRRHYNATHREELKQYFKEHYRTHREERLSKRKIYYQEHRDEILKKTRDYRENNLALVRDNYNRYMRENRNVAKAKEHRRKALKRNLPTDFSPDDWQRALEYWNYSCAVCGRQLEDLFGTHSASLDHWIPLVSPDCPGTIPTNVVPLCCGIGGCNNSKKDRNPEEWLNERYGKRKAKQILARIMAYFESVKGEK